MKTATVDVLDESVNYVVLRTEGRRFPGIVVQGDGVKKMVMIAQETLAALKQSDLQEAIDATQELHTELLSRVQHYESVLVKEGIELPYQQRFVPRPE